jgi:site-specific DNA-methyltransferase (adenine-specific)
MQMTGPILYKRKEIIGDCTLYLGDCREVLPTLGKVDSCITDPPYGVGLTVKSYKGSTNEGDGYASFDDTPENVQATVIPAIKAAIKISRCVLVTPGTECAWLYPKPKDVGSIYNSAGTGSGSWGFKTSTPVLFYGACPYLATGKGRRANSWQQPADDHSEKSTHPCPKPLGMMRWLVTRGSLNGETVLDPFMGSGTTGVACVKLGRKFIGIELDESYFNIACERIRKAYAQPDMFISSPTPKATQETML